METVKATDRVFVGILIMIFLGLLLFAVASLNVDIRYWISSDYRIAYDRYYQVYGKPPPDRSICLPGAYDGGFCMNGPLRSVDGSTPTP